ncbi:hypothetical protein BDZ89DRAFT_939246, partial [Hymenopellis radicata]
VENHRRDIKNAMRSLLRSGVAPVFPQHLWEKVLLDEPVDFDEINGFFFSFSTKLDVEEKKTVNTAVAWLRCFDKYSEAVETVFPHRAAELRAWRRHIDDLFTAKGDESHIRVIAYDIAARKVIGSSPAILFNQCDARELVSLRMVSAARPASTFMVPVEEPSRQQPSRGNAERFATIGTRASALGIHVPDDTSAVPAKDCTSPAPAKQKETEPSAGHPFLSGLLVDSLEDDNDDGSKACVESCGVEKDMSGTIFFLRRGHEIMNLRV